MDVSKSYTQFRNLEYNFIIDNGYLLFDAFNKNNKLHKIMNMEETIFNIIKNNLISNIDTIGATDQQILYLINNSLFNSMPVRLVNSKKPLQLSNLEEKDEKNILVTEYCMIIGICQKSNAQLTIKPGQHHMLAYHNVKNIKCIKSYELKMRQNQFIFLHPFLMHDIIINDMNCIDWYIVKANVDINIDVNVNINSIDSNIMNINMWEYWDIFRNKCEYTPLNEISNHEFFKKNPSTLQDMIVMETNNHGQFMRINNDHIIFRIKPTDSTGFLKLISPSIYEDVIEVVYYFDMVDRLAQHNYDQQYKFEVRTGGIIARSCNENFSKELYHLCSINSSANKNNNSLEKFQFDLQKIINFFKYIDYAYLISKWYPISIKELIFNNRNNQDNQDNKNDDDANDDNDNNTYVKLNVKKQYTVEIYKFEIFDALEKYKPKIDLITLWMNELNLKGGFIFSNDKKTPGYMIVGGEVIVIINKNNINNLTLFQKRFKCLHWKKVKYYHYSNHDYISHIDYNNLPMDHFCLIKSELSMDKHSELIKIIENI